ncbi:hypothetical protein [Nocardia sp. NPDC050175]|uniref:hypothetical protein n=1 Tax=Nocardia sp. NPDC050175 TaxID=3364317 RepID=UPI00379A344B
MSDEPARRVVTDVSTTQATDAADQDVVPANETTDLGAIAATEVKPEATLALHYREGAAMLVATSGTAIPAQLTVTDGDGQTIAVYTAGPALKVQARELNPNHLWEVPISYSTRQ